LTVHCEDEHIQVVISVPHLKVCVQQLYQILTHTATVLMHSHVCTLLLFISVEQECVQWTEPCCACAWAVM